jgi:hypothetical protein
MRELMARLRAQAANGVNIDVDVRKGFDDQIAGMAEKLTQVGDGAGFAGQQFAGLSRIGWIVVAVFAAAAPLIGLVAGLLAGLPSLIAAFGAGVGVVALGLDGIKAAAKLITPALDARC